MSGRGARPPPARRAASAWKPGSPSTSRKLPGRQRIGSEPRRRDPQLALRLERGEEHHEIGRRAGRARAARPAPRHGRPASAWRRPHGLRLPPAHRAQVDGHRDQDHQHVDDAERGGQADVAQRALEGDLVHVGDHRVVAEARVAVVERPHDRKRVEDVDDVQHDGHEQGRAQQRQRHRPVRPPRARRRRPARPRRPRRGSTARPASTT